MEPAATNDGHLSYLERLLDGAVRRESASEFLYITRTEGRPGFWELLAFKIPGLERAVVGAVHFQSQSDDPLAFARRSLAHFLTSPPQPISLVRSSYPADVIEVRVPREGETLPDLVGALKRGEETACFYLDSELIEAAADFRADNPSLQRPINERGSSQRLLFRTASGHVLRATATNFAQKLRRAGNFVTLTGVEQLGAGGGWIRLPTLVVRRSFLTGFTEPPADDDPRLPASFSPAIATTGHLLDVRLGSGSG